MKPDDLLRRLEQFAADVLEMADSMPRSAGAWALGNHIARSSVSIPQNYAESQAASSKRHFITCVEVAEREARETLTSLRIIELRSYADVSKLKDEADQIVAILTSIVKKAKKNP